eukprot:6630692-Karenia_brevis.AAC.1
MAECATPDCAGNQMTAPLAYHLYSLGSEWLAVVLSGHMSRAAAREANCKLILQRTVRHY